MDAVNAPGARIETVTIPRALYDAVLATLRAVATRPDAERLLRDEIQAVYRDHDAVERAMVFSNPYPRQAHGRFGFGAAPKATGGAGKGAGGAKGKGAGGAKKTATKASAKTPTKTPTKKAIAKGEFGNPDVSVHGDHVLIKIHDHTGKLHQAKIEADENLGGYKISTKGAGEKTFTPGMEGLSATSVNAYMHGFTGKTKAFDKSTLPAGAKKTKAEKDAYKAKKAAHDDFVKKLPKGGNTLEVGLSLDHMAFVFESGHQVEVTKTIKGYTVVHIPVDAHGQLDTAHATKTYAKNMTEVNQQLKGYGIKNKFTTNTLKNTNGVLATNYYANKGNYAKQQATGHGISAHLFSSAITEAEPGDTFGSFRLSLNGHTVEMTAQANADPALHGALRLTVDGKTELDAASPAETTKWLTDRGASPRVEEFAHMAHDDMVQYGSHGSALRPDIQAQRDALDTKYGKYSLKAARNQVESIYKQYPELKTGVLSHESGGQGTHLNPGNIAKQFKNGTPTEKLVRAQEAYKQLSEVSEWSVLHDPRLTPDGTIRLFHGTNGHTNPTGWEDRLHNGKQRAGIPFTERLSVAKHFANRGKGGRFILSAHVPASSISIWYEIRSTPGYGTEHEYTVGGGKITHTDFIHVVHKSHSLRELIRELRGVHIWQLDTRTRA
ncbi:MAG TPA: hypothetical protein VKQ30_26320 [Ktedonobacterales bacterium]|nr:hypothetical protein [Ktedonobacterales bacterium]